MYASGCRKIRYVYELYMINNKRGKIIILKGKEERERDEEEMKRDRRIRKDRERKGGKER